MNRIKNETIAQRNLSKNKKYYSYNTIKKDKENILDGDISSIIEKLSFEKKLRYNTIIKNKYKDPLSFLQNNQIRNSVDKNKFVRNSVHFFQQHQHTMMLKTDFKKQIMHYMGKIRQPPRFKCSLYQEFLLLSEQTNDYLQYYLTNFTGEDPGRATSLLKEEGKTIILLILKRNYKFFQANSQDINNRIFLAFNLNPLNDFQFIPWEKFMKLRKLISGDFNKKDYSDFLVKYFINHTKNTIIGNELWLIFSSVLRKLTPTLDISHLQLILDRARQSLFQLVGENELISADKLRTIIHQQPLFIWEQFVTLVFL